jgi:hypothetical protein
LAAGVNGRRPAEEGSDIGHEHAIQGDSQDVSGLSGDRGSIQIYSYDVGKAGTSTKDQRGENQIGFLHKVFLRDLSL